MASKTDQSVKVEKKEFKLPKSFENLGENTSLLHLNVIRQLSNTRSGTASTKTRAEVRGGGAKPWKQKGTGRARAGSIRSPLFVGGGITFGPKPRDFSFKIPKKARNKAIAQAIVAKKDDITLLAKLPEIKDGKTKVLNTFINSLGLKDQSVLVVCSSDEKNYADVKQAARNLKLTSVKEWEYVSVYDLVKSENIIFSEDAFKNLEDKLSANLSKKAEESKGAA